MIISHDPVAGFVAAFMQCEQGARNALVKRGWGQIPGTRALRIAEHARGVLHDCAQYHGTLDSAGCARYETLASEAAARVAPSHATTSTIVAPAPDGQQYMPFQLAGVEYLRDHRDVILGDEMGLGKTIQVIGLANLDPEINSVLVVCPAGLKLNWKREFEAWSTREWTIAIAGAGKKQDALLPEANVVIVNYDVLDKYSSTLTTREWGLIAYDEAHYLKNKFARRTGCAFGVTEGQAYVKLAKRHLTGDDCRGYSFSEKRSLLRSRMATNPALRAEFEGLVRVGLRGRRRVFITGTPIPNRVMELFPLLQQIDPGGLGRDWEAFGVRYCAGYETRYGWDMTGASNLPELQQILRETLMIRRLKTDVLTDLPDKRRQVVEVEASGALGKIVKREIEADARHTVAIAAKRRAVDAASPSENKAAYDAAVAALREAQAAEFAEMSALRHELAVAKLPAVIEHVQALLDGSCEKVVVMAHHKDVIADLATAYPGSAILTGDTSAEARQAAVDRFQTNPECRVFIGSIRAAGVGITLTAASTVVFAEQDWSPGVMQQAEDRCHRIGQKSSVLSQVLVVDGSLDAKFARTLARKETVIAKTLNGGAQ